MVTNAGLDIGRSGVKAYSGLQRFYIPSIIGEWRDRRLKSNFGEHDLDIEFNGERYFAGSLAENESEFFRKMMTEEKDHEDTRLLALIALHRIGATDYNVCTGLPVNKHDNARKGRLAQLLVGTWTITVNGVKRSFTVNNVAVAVEGGAAFWSAPSDGLVRVIDAGSKTVNYVTMSDRRYIDRDSGTLDFGFDTNKSGDIRHMSARIAGEVGKKWSKRDTVRVCGGRAEELTERLRDYFVNVEVIPNPLYANVIGYYNAINTRR